MKFVLLLIVHTLVGQNMADDWIIETPLIWNPNAFPVLGNGHLGFTVFDNSLYMNGLYNGAMTDSHRARIENHGNLQMAACDVRRKTNTDLSCTYRLNLKTGIFEVMYTSSEFKVTQSIFPHRYYTRTLVNKFTIERLDAKAGNVSMTLNYDPGNIAHDLTFPGHQKIQKNGVEFTCETGTTLYKESEQYQAKLQGICTCYSVLSAITLNETERSTKDYYTFMIVDESDVVVHNELDRVIKDSSLMRRHTELWEEFWSTFDIELEGKSDAGIIARTSIFYLVSNMPSSQHFQPPREFYGISSSGLGRVDSQTKGRVTWDMDMFMHLPLLLMNPEWGKEILDYRYRVHAEDMLSDGWTYFWETGYTGNHLDILKEMLRATHVPADVSFALRQYLSATQDMSFFRDYGCQMAYKTARYWAKRAMYNSTSDLYDLDGVGAEGDLDDMMPNNAFLNVAAGYNLYLGDLATCVCDLEHEFRFSEIARSLTLPLDTKDNVVKVHSGYETYIRTSGADTLLTLYPLQYKLPEEVKINTLQHYRDAMISSIPPTTWALHLMADLELGRTSTEFSLFYHLTSDYITKPFYVWSDTPNIGQGTVFNFISGGAAFLQVLMNGYGGIRLFFDRMEISKPMLPPDTDRFKVKGIQYLGARFSVEVLSGKYVLSLMDSSHRGDVKLIAEIEGKRFAFDTPGDKVTAKSFEKIIIRNENSPYGECKIPDLTIGIPKSQVLLESLPTRARANGTRVLLGCLFVVLIAILASFAFIMYRRNGTVLPKASMRYIRTTA